MQLHDHTLLLAVFSTSRKLSERSRKLWKDSVSEDLATYWAIENVSAYYLQTKYSFMIIRYYWQYFLKFLTMFRAENHINKLYK